MSPISGPPFATLLSALITSVTAPFRAISARSKSRRKRAEKRRTASRSSERRRSFA